MPELPEVEANLRNLARWAKGRRIVNVTAPPGTRETGGLSAEEFARRLEDRTIVETTRRAKWMLVRLSGGAGLGLHLGMTGRLSRVASADAATPRLTRAVFALEDGSRV